MKKVLILVLLFVLSGCASFTSRSFSISANKKSNFSLKSEQKKNITFSISLYQQITDMSSSLNEEDLIKEIKEKLKECKLFNKIYYTKKHKNDNHIHFDVVVTGTPAFNTSVKGYFFLWTIPMWSNIYVDITMFYYKNNKEVFSLSAAQKVKDVFWLPFIIVSPVLNHATAGSRIRENALDYFLNAIIEEKLYE